MGRYHDRSNTQFPGDGNGVQGARASERNERVFSWIDTPFNRKQSNGVGHVFVCNVNDCQRRLFDRAPDAGCQRPDGFARSFAIYRQFSTQEECRVEPPEDEVCVGYGRGCVPPLP
jgi:hypothetical protein